MLQWEKEYPAQDEAFRSNSFPQPNYYNAYAAAQNRIDQYIFSIVDRNFIFRDVKVSQQFKSLVASGFNGKNPALAIKIKKSINLTPAPNAVQSETLQNMETLASDYSYGGNSELNKVQASILGDMSDFLIQAQVILQCEAKRRAAGLYSSFYEVVVGKDFCAGQALDMTDRSISAVEFSFDSASILGYKPALGAGFAVGMGRVISKLTPILSKIPTKKITEMLSLITGIVSNFSREQLSKLGVNGLLTKAKRVIDSAVKQGIPAERIGLLIGDMKTWGKTKGNFDIPDGSTKEASFLGESWVGSNPVKKDYGGKPGKFIYVSQDGTKRFREPVIKTGGRKQANFEWKDSEGKWIGNGHMDITD